MIEIELLKESKGKKEKKKEGKGAEDGSISWLNSSEKIENYSSLK